MVASPGHPELNVEKKKKKCLKRCGPIPFRTISDNPT